MAKMLHIPEVLGIQEARNRLSNQMLEDLEHGQTFIVKGTKGKLALIISPTEYRALQEAYNHLAEKLEAHRALDREETREALQAAAEEEPPHSEEELVTPTEVKDEYLTKQHS